MKELCQAATASGRRCHVPWIHTNHGFKLCAYHYNRIKLLGGDGEYMKRNGKITKVTMFSESEWCEKNRGMRAEDV